MLSPVKQAAALQHGQHIVLYEKKNQIKLFQQRKAALRGSVSTFGNLGKQRCTSLPAVREGGAGLLKATSASPSRDLSEPLLKAVTMLRDTRLLGTLPQTQQWSPIAATLLRSPHTTAILNSVPYLCYL